jgi:hypothetical protein
MIYRKMDKVANETKSTDNWLTKAWGHFTSTGCYKLTLKLSSPFYARPKILVPITTMFSGTLLSIGTSFFLNIISVEKIQRPGTIQYLGLGLIVIALLWAWWSWSTQQFLDEMRDTKDENGKAIEGNTIEQKKRYYRTLYNGRDIANISFWAAILFFLAFSIAFALMVCAGYFSNNIQQATDNMTG